MTKDLQIHLLEIKLAWAKYCLEQISNQAKQGLKNNSLLAKFWLGLILAELDNCR